MKELISVVVPVYNAETSILRCINSILQQKDVAFEIIIVDDGSEDRSLEICRQQELLHKEITVYHTENRGVSHARNLGIEKASGTWLVFVDADDELMEGALLASMKTQKKYSSDTVCWNMVSITRKGNCLHEKFKVKSNLAEKKEKDDLLGALYHIPSKKGYFYGTLIRAAWGKMYLLQIILKNNIRFIEGMTVGEDAAFLFEYFNHCKRVAFLDQPLYKYYEIGDSVTKRYKENIFLLQKQEAVVIKKVYEKYGMNPEKALVCFWNIAFIDYIMNELKKKQSVFKVTVKANLYLKNHIVRKYLIKNKSTSAFSRLKSILIKIDLTWIVSCIYVYICKKQI